MDYVDIVAICVLLALLWVWVVNHASLTWLKQVLAIVDKWKLPNPSTVSDPQAYDRDLKAYLEELAIFMDKRFWYKPFVPKRSITLVQNLMESLGQEMISNIFKHSVMDAQEKQDEPN